MADGAVIFALANPDPEIEPEAAARRAAVVATGRSDHPNQINNVLAFGAEHIVPSVFDERLVPAVAHAVAGEAAHPR
jgi:malate dehydrogenase (oxaloacetate-decarboxylating)